MGVTIGLLHVRRSILIQADRRRVWQEFGSFERFAAWFGRGHTLHAFEPRLGAAVDLSVEIEGERRHFGGPVRIWEPEAEVTFESNWVGAGASALPTLFTIRLTPVYEHTLVEIFHHGFERLGVDAAENLEGYEQGWDVKHLSTLRGLVEANA